MSDCYVFPALKLSMDVMFFVPLRHQDITYIEG